MRTVKACIFDLDGVIVDTARFHFLAWRRLARELGGDLKESDNERLKGVSRMKSLEILLEILNTDLDEKTKIDYATKKNNWYVEYVNSIDEKDILKGSQEFLRFLREQGIKTGLASGSKNAGLVLEKTGLIRLFDVVIDGNDTRYPKPDPEVFLKAAESLGEKPYNCIVFEDAQTGIDAANTGGFISIGVGNPNILKNAVKIIPSFENIDYHELLL